MVGIVESNEPVSGVSVEGVNDSRSEVFGVEDEADSWEGSGNGWTPDDFRMPLWYRDG